MVCLTRNPTPSTLNANPPQPMQYKDAADIAIVKLNPLNVLGTKLRGENRVR